MSKQPSQMSEATALAIKDRVREIYPFQKNKNGSKIVFIFDDGYERVYTNALDLFKKYGFTATVAQEIDRINQDYSGDADLPVLKTEQLRELINSGWEICNHPNLTLTDTEAVMYDKAKAENELLVNILTGAKVMSTSGVVTDGEITNTEFADYIVSSSVYRGGSRSDDSDNAYKCLYDKTRTINGPIATRGDHLFTLPKNGERTMMSSALSCDTAYGGSLSIEYILNYIQSVAQSGSIGIIYAHDVLTGSSTSGYTPPAINQDHLELIFQKCIECGIEITTYKDAYKGNLLDTLPNQLLGVHYTSADYFTEEDETVYLNNIGKSIKITANVKNTNSGNGYDTNTFTIEPFTKYRLTLRYRIDVELGVTSIDHGLTARMIGFQGNTANDENGYDVSNN